MSPKVAMWVNILISVLAGIAGGTAVMTPVFGQGETQLIVQYTGFALFVLGLFNTALHSVSTSVAGPMLKWLKKGA